MASEDPVKTEPAPSEERAPVEVFKVHSMVRATATRLHRMKAPAHHRLVQRLAGGQITVRRARPATITRAALEQHLPELRKAVKEGRIAVKTMNGLDVDLETLTVVSARPVTPPLPHPRLDSAANDVTFPGGVGQKIEQFEGGGTEGDKPALSVQAPLTSNDEPIQVTGDPAKVRAAQEQQTGPEQQENPEESFGEESLGEDPLGDDEPTEPDALPASKGSSRSKRKSEKHERGGK